MEVHFLKLYWNLFNCSIPNHQVIRNKVLKHQFTIQNLQNLFWLYILLSSSCGGLQHQKDLRASKTKYWRKRGRKNPVQKPILNISICQSRDLNAGLNFRIHLVKKGKFKFKVDMCINDVSNWIYLGETFGNFKWKKSCKIQNTI